MALSEHEQKVFKAFSSLLSHDLLGLSIHDQKESSHYSQFRWNGIKDAYRLKVADSPYSDSLSAAFAKVHDYKYIDHPTFKIAMEAEMKSMGLPTYEMEMGLKVVDSLISELNEKNPGEKDAGWNPAMKEIKDVTTNADNRNPETNETFSGGGPTPKGTRKLQMK